MTQNYGPICGSPHPELGARKTKDGEHLTPVTCTARHDLKGMVVVPHKSKHRAKLGRHLIRWAQ